MFPILIEKYFQEAGLDVSFNTLGLTDAAKLAFVNETQASVDAVGKSNDIKHALYSRYYDFEPREKFTGFEKFKESDIEFRTKMSKVIADPQFAPAHVVDKTTSADVDYRHHMIAELSKMKSPLLYLSGGLDSEFVARLMLEAEIKFTPVIFQWVDKTGTIKNSHDTQYAFKFCEINNLTPIVKSVDVETLWKSDEFMQLSEAIQMISPQMTTYAYMVNIMESELPGSKHVFGGEVRYYADYVKDDGSVANLVFQAKVTPGYSGGGGYSKSYLYAGDGASSSCYLTYSSSGSWGVGFTGPGTSSGAPTSGTWTNTPGSTYEYRISAIANAVQSNGSLSPASAPTGWTTISSNTIASATTALGSGVSTVEGIFTIEVRAVANPGVVMTSTIILGAYREL